MSLSDASINPIITDPPYGINYKSRSRRLPLDRKRGKSGGLTGEVHYIDEDTPIVRATNGLIFPTDKSPHENPPTSSPSQPHSQ